MESRREEQTSYELIKSIENTDGFYLFYEPKVLQRSFVEIFKLQTQMEQIHEVLETELQNSDSILLIMSDYIPPTNHSALLGFDEIIEFKGPSKEERRRLMEESLRGRMGEFSWDDGEDNIISLTGKLSHAEIHILCRQALKANAGSGKSVTETDLITLMKSGRLNGTNGMNGILNGLKKS